MTNANDKSTVLTKRTNLGGRFLVELQKLDNGIEFLRIIHDAGSTINKLERQIVPYTTHAYQKITVSPNEQQSWLARHNDQKEEKEKNSIVLHLLNWTDISSTDVELFLVGFKKTDSLNG